MSEAIELRTNEAPAALIAQHLRECDRQFVPPLSERVDLGAYADKLAARAERVEAWSGGSLVGLVAAYLDGDAGQRAFVTSVSVLPRWQGRGIAARLLAQCAARAAQRGCRRVELEVHPANERALALYARAGFTLQHSGAACAVLRLDLERSMP